MEFNFNFDPCPFPRPDNFNGLTAEWGQSSYVNPPFGVVPVTEKNAKGQEVVKMKGVTGWVRKAIEENKKGKTVVMVYPVDKWLLMLLGAGAEVRNLGDVKWCATEDGAPGKGTGQHVACFILRGKCE